MAALTIVGVRDVQMANAQKNLLATIITTASVGVFVVAYAVAWPQTLFGLIGALIGGYDGTRAARHIPAAIMRAVVVAVGLFFSGFSFFHVIAASILSFPLPAQAPSRPHARLVQKADMRTNEPCPDR